LGQGSISDELEGGEQNGNEKMPETSKQRGAWGGDRRDRERKKENVKISWQKTITHVDKNTHDTF